MQDILARAAEQMSADESLRSNLDDEQASAALNRALSWLERRLSQAAAELNAEQEVAYAANALRAVNARQRLPQPPALQAILDEMLPLSGSGLPQVGRADAVNKMPLLQRMVSRLRSIWRRAGVRDASKH